MIIDNFLGPAANQRVLELIDQMGFDFIPGEISLDTGANAVVADFKRNNNIWLDQFDSEIVHAFQNRLFDVGVVDPELDHKNKSYAVLLSQYLPGDYYNWHTDLGGSVTWSYVCHPEPVAGGQLVLSTALYNQEPQETMPIDSVNDRLIIFPAQYQHQVTAVESGCRYSVQLFFR
jgi:Rps23 Pro-64 3,4-dihydroxylase Tpa1-like proline 4-hydroxylase